MCGVDVTFYLHFFTILHHDVWGKSRCYGVEEECYCSWGLSMASSSVSGLGGRLRTVLGYTSSCGVLTLLYSVGMSGTRLGM